MNNDVYVTIGPKWAWTQWRRGGHAVIVSLFGWRVWIALRSRRTYIPFSEREGYRVPCRIGPFDVHFWGRE